MSWQKATYHYSISYVEKYGIWLPGWKYKLDRFTTRGSEAHRKNDGV